MKEPNYEALAPGVHGLADDDQPALHEGALAVVGKSTT
jgi:hypothetical protein